MPAFGHISGVAAISGVAVSRKQSLVGNAAHDEGRWLMLTAPPACQLRWTHPNASIQPLGLYLFESGDPAAIDAFELVCVSSSASSVLRRNPMGCLCIDPYASASEPHPTSSNACAISSAPIGIASFGRRFLLGATLFFIAEYSPLARVYAVQEDYFRQVRERLVRTRERIDDLWSTALNNMQTRYINERKPVLLSKHDQSWHRATESTTTPTLHSKDFRTRVRKSRPLGSAVREAGYHRKHQAGIEPPSVAGSTGPPTTITGADMDLDQNTQPQDDRTERQTTPAQLDPTQQTPQPVATDPTLWNEQAPNASEHEPGDIETASGTDDANAVSPGDEASQQLTSAVDAVGSFFTQGASAMREMNAARRAHATARSELEAIGDAIEDEEAELTHRQDVTARYKEIIATESARKTEAEKKKAACELEQERLQGEIDDLKDELKKMKDADAQNEKRLKAALDAAEAREASARESGSRLQRRLDDAKRNLEKAEEDNRNGVAAAQAAVESTSNRLAMLREEYAEIQRNPSANSAAYSVRADELEADISDAARELQAAQDDLPRVTQELADELERARWAVSEAEKPIDEAKKQFREISDAADEARNTYREAKDDAAERQRTLRDQISAQEKAKREQEQQAADAEDEAMEAQALLDEANDIHAHPEVTAQLAARLENDRAVFGVKSAQVEKLAGMEHDVRLRTRGSRVRFIGAIVAIAIVVIAIVALVIFLMNR